MNTSSIKAAPTRQLITAHTPETDLAAFAFDVEKGLSREKKALSARFLYDETGSRLFQQIMHLPEYYLTRCEFSILEEQKTEICRHFSRDGFFNLVDLGAGDGLKTRILLRQLSQQQAEFAFLPVDISQDALQQLAEKLQAEQPELQVMPLASEYFNALKWLEAHKQEPKIVLFLGSNIGNLSPSERFDFLKEIRSHLKENDKILIGFDLRKDPLAIRQAYDDAAGVTAAFNLNLLRRINRELGGTFDLSRFRHFTDYDPVAGVVKSYLVSTEEQEIYIRDLNALVHFDAWETIHTESAYKFSMDEITELAENCGLKIDETFTDSKGYFADVLFSVVA